MRRNWRAVAAALGVMGLAAVLLPANAGAQKVFNPGAFSLQSTGGQIRIGSAFDLDLTPQPTPQCSDGIDNDGDTKLDGLDLQCAAGTAGQPKDDDDNELAPGFQPKVNVSITGTVDAGGVVSVPAANVIFPPAYVPFISPFDGITYVVRADILATQNATGSIDPISGIVTLNVKFRAKISGVVAGNALSSGCSIGTTQAPISLTLTTERMEAIGNNPALTGAKYNATNGAAILINNNFAVPAATSCIYGTGLFAPDIAPQISQSLFLPSPAGSNAAVLAGKTTPALGKGIDAKITSAPTVLSGAAPFTAAFKAATSIVAKQPATYSWTFGDGGTAATADATHTFAGPGVYPVELKVTDADGDSATAKVTVTVTGVITTTTTTAPTTTTTAPTTTTTAPTTTTTAPTTTTTAPTTTTTVPQPSADSVSVKFAGSVNYLNSGTGNGNLTVQRDAFGIAKVGGFLDVPGTSGGTARVTVDVQRVWILPLWAGQVIVSDPGAHVSVTTPVIGSLSRGTTTASATTTSNWFTLGAFPNLLQPYSLNWSVVDAG